MTLITIHPRIYACNSLKRKPHDFIPCWCCRTTLSRRSRPCRADQHICGFMTGSRTTSAATSWHSTASRMTSSCMTPDVNFLSIVSRSLITYLLCRCCFFLFMSLSLVTTVIYINAVFDLRNLTETHDVIERSKLFVNGSVLWWTVAILATHMQQYISTSNKQLKLNL